MTALRGAVVARRSSLASQQKVEQATRRAIGEHLGRLRRDQGLTLHGVADRLGELGVEVSHSTISRMERGLTSVSIGFLLAACEALGTSLGDLEELIRAQSSTASVQESLDDRQLLARMSDFARKGDYAAAMRQIEAARDWLDENPGVENHARRVVEVILYEIEARRRLRQYSMSLRLASRLLNENQPGPEVEFRALLAHVQIYGLTGAHYQALLFANRAQELWSEVGPRWRAFADGVVSHLYFKLERYADAIPLLERARDSYKSENIEIEVARLGITLGVCLQRVGRGKDGLAMVRRSTTTARKAGWHDVESYGLRMLGRFALKRGDWEGARKHLDLARRSAAKIGSRSDQFMAMFDLWKGLQDSSDPAHRRLSSRLGRSLKKLLPDVDRRLPEVALFIRALRSVEEETS